MEAQGYKNEVSDINFRVKCGKRKRSTLKGFSTFTNSRDFEEYPITAKFYNDEEKAKAEVSRLQCFNTPSIIKSHFVRHSTEGTTGVTERVPRRFRSWVQKPNKEIWRLNKARTVILCMGKDFTFVFRQIGKALWKMVLAGEAHGNLKKGVFISQDQTVKLSNLDVDSEDNFDKCLKRDIEDFKKMVEHVVNSHTPHHPLPVALDLFYKLCDAAKSMAGKELRDMSFFVFNNCLFFDSEDRVQFFFSIWDFVESNVCSFNKFMNFKKPGAAQMLGWHKVLSRIQHTSLKQVYKYKQMATKVFARGYGIVYFYRHAYVHYPDQFRYRCRVADTDMVLLEALPDFYPKYFYLVATNLRRNEGVFMRRRKIGLVDFLERRVSALMCRG